MNTRKMRLATVTRNIHGQMRRITVASFGSGSDLSFGLKIRYDLEEVSTQRKVQEEVTWRLPRIVIRSRCRGRHIGWCLLGPY